MRVLWVSAAVNGPAGDILNYAFTGSSGGWIKAAYEQMEKDERFKEVEMFYLCSDKSIKKYKIIKSYKNNQTAYCVRMNKVSFGVKPKRKQINQFKRIINEINPDVIHIWGTEMTTTYVASLVAKEIPCVLFIQGIIGIQTRYMGGYIDQLNDSKYYGFLGKLLRMKDKIKIRCYKKQARFERQMIMNCKNAIAGIQPTDDYIRSINNQVRIFETPFCVNKEFYNCEWKEEKIEKNSIFTVFGRTADKGLSQLLKALVIVKKTHPNIVLNIPGRYSFIGKKSIKKSLRMTTFEIWMENFIIEHNLLRNVRFLGYLSPKQMAEQLEKSNIFVNPSIMETHAGALREALIVGVPSITSLCGSVNDFVLHEKNALVYRYEEHEVLASHICKLIDDTDFANEISVNARKSAKNGFVNDKQQPLMSIYQEIINN